VSAAEELDRLPLQLALPALIGFEDRPGTGAEGAMVEEDHARIEQEVGLERIRHAG
jgi:hypothetical protein